MIDLAATERRREGENERLFVCMTFTINFDLYFQRNFMVAKNASQSFLLFSCLVLLLLNLFLLSNWIEKELNRIVPMIQGEQLKCISMPFTYTRVLQVRVAGTVTHQMHKNSRFHLE